MLLKLDWATIKSTVVSYLRAVLWLTVVTWLPPHINCFITGKHCLGTFNWMTSLTSLFLASCGFFLDTASHRFETGLFFAPKVLGILYSMLMMRGLVFWDHKNKRPRLDGSTVESISLALVFGIFGIMTGLQKNPEGK